VAWTGCLVVCCVHDLARCVCTEMMSVSWVCTCMCMADQGSVAWCMTACQHVASHSVLCDIFGSRCTVTAEDGWVGGSRVSFPAQNACAC
jgi:hypothetical protein